MKKVSQGTLIAMLVLLALLASGIWLLALQKGYPFVLASEEARQSLTVTADQQAELVQARRASDVVAFGIGGTLMLLAIWIPVGLSMNQRACNWSAKNLAFGGFVFAVFGLLAGFLGGWIGGKLEAMPSFDIQDPMLYQFLRLTAMFLPVALVAGSLSAVFCRSTDLGIRAILGGILGACVGVLACSLLSGTISHNEGREFVLPFHNLNRFLLFMSTTLGIGGGLLAVLGVAGSSVAEDSPANAAKES